MATQTFTDTSGQLSWTVPALVYRLRVQLLGAGSGDAAGGREEFTVPVQPGDVVYVNCGHKGARASLGGGLTDIRLGGSTVGSQGVAGGAGAPGNNGTITSTNDGSVNYLPGGAGGAGGGLTGEHGQAGQGYTYNGATTPGGAGGVGGDQSTPNDESVHDGGGIGWNSGSDGLPGSSTSAPGVTVKTASGGGGGGSGHVVDTAPRGPITDVVHTTGGGNSGDGTVVITYTVATPLAPVPQSPVSGADVDGSQPVTLTAEFATPAGSGATLGSGQLRYKTAGDASWTTVTAVVDQTAGTVSTSLSGLAPDVQVEWQAQTTDSYGNTSAWSVSSFFAPRTVPAAPLITAPAAGTVIASLAVNPMQITGPAGQTDARFRRVGDDQGSADADVVFEDTGPLGAPATSHAFAAAVAHLSGPEHWQAQVRTNSTLWSPWADVPVTMTVAVPPAPVLTEVVQSSPPTVVVTITNPAPDGEQAETVSTDLYRTWGGVEAPIAADLPNGATVTDWLPGPGDNGYRAVAKAVNGATAASK